MLLSTRCHYHHRRTFVTLSLTDQNHQTGPLIGPLLVAGHLFISQEVAVSRIRALSGGSLPVLTTQPETPP